MLLFLFHFPRHNSTTYAKTFFYRRTYSESESSFPQKKKNKGKDLDGWMASSDSGSDGGKTSPGWCRDSSAGKNKEPKRFFGFLDFFPAHFFPFRLIRQQKFRSCTRLIFSKTRAKFFGCSRFSNRNEIWIILFTEKEPPIILFNIWNIFKSNI